jgi:hypothetical protein
VRCRLIARKCRKSVRTRSMRAGFRSNDVLSLRRDRIPGTCAMDRRREASDDEV